MSHKLFQEANDALEKGRLEIAFKKVKDILELVREKDADIYRQLNTDFTLLSGQFHSYVRRENLNLSDETVLVKSQTKISRSLVDLIDESSEILGYENRESYFSWDAISFSKKIGKQEVRLVLNINKEEFDQAEFLLALNQLLHTSEVKIKKIEFGSVIITLKVPNKHLENLEKIFKDDSLSDWKPIGMELGKRISFDQRLLNILKARGIKYKSEGKIIIHGADLRKVNLIKADLSSMDLRWANFHESDLSIAKFKDSILLRANLSSVDLVGADFNSANLRKADLSGSNLRGASLINADLFGANLTMTKLGASYFNEASLITAKLIESELFRAKLVEADLSEADLREADLREANLEMANLRGANLQDANLEKADLKDANLEDTNLYRAILREADFRGVNLKGCILDRAILNGAIFHISQKEDLENLNIDIGEVIFVDDEGNSIYSESLVKV